LARCGRARVVQSRHEGIKKAGVNVSFVDVSAQLGGSYASDVQRMQQAGSQLVVTCKQASDNVTLARDIQQAGFKMKQYWLNGDLTQAGVVSATNTLTNFTARGVVARVNWSKGHVGYTEPICGSFVPVKGTNYVTVCAAGKRFFVFLGPSVKNPVPVTPPEGTPGA
jgi:hypothetical protein